MSRHRLLFYGTETSSTTEHTLECFVNGRNEIFIEINCNEDIDFPSQHICIDVSTAIKFSKTLRTAINQAKDE